MKKLMMIAIASAVAIAAEAAPKRGPQAMPGNEDGPETTGKEAKILIDQFPRLGRQSRLMAPSLQGASMIGQCYKKPREWIVLEAKYTTYAKWQDQLTFTWHVLLESASATEKAKDDIGKMSPYSYFTTSVTYYNIPRGSHAASVCLHPSYLERFGEAKAVGIVISNKNGDILAGDTVSEVKGIKAGTQFWDDDKIMDAKTAKGEQMIERRQGLLDRSKTIWSLVNPNDYELVIQ